MSEYLVLSEKNFPKTEVHVVGDYDDLHFSVRNRRNFTIGFTLAGKEIERLHETLGRIVALKDLYEVKE